MNKMIQTPNYCVLILSYKRPDSVRTYTTLRKCGYKGPIFIVVGDDDPTMEQYKAKYGDEVVVFSKLDYLAQTDLFDNRTNELGTVLFARNACPDIVRGLGYTHWIELDDDYAQIRWRTCLDQYKPKALNCFQQVFDAVWDLYESGPYDMLALAQGGDFIGGVGGVVSIPPKRKVMNSFFCSLDRHSSFLGRMNDDVNTYVKHGNSGKIFVTIKNACIEQAATQQNEGGLTEMYKTHGTYVKSFYTVMACPSCTTVKSMTTAHARWHHSITWNQAVPKIVPERFRK